MCLTVYSTQANNITYVIFKTWTSYFLSKKYFLHLTENLKSNITIFRCCVVHRNNIGDLTPKGCKWFCGLTKSVVELEDPTVVYSDEGFMVASNTSLSTRESLFPNSERRICYHWCTVSNIRCDEVVHTYDSIYFSVGNPMKLIASLEFSPAEQLIVRMMDASQMALIMESLPVPDKVWSQVNKTVFGRKFFSQ